MRIQLLLAVACILFSAAVTAQPTSPDSAVANNILPVFKGNFNSFFKRAMDYPPHALRGNLQGLVLMQFVVDAKGHISNIQVDKNSPQKDDELVAEAKRVLLLTDSMWIPAMKGGVPVKAITIQAARFILPAGADYKNAPADEIKAGEDFIYTKAETDPKFQGNFKKHLEKELVYPAAAMQQRIGGIVIVSFVVDTKGRVYGCMVDDKSPQKNPHLVQEAIRVITLSSGQWKSATQNGYKVQCLHMQSINFVL